MSERMTSEELAEIEKRADLYERYDLRESIHMICDRIAEDRAALLAHLRASQTPPHAVTVEAEEIARNVLHYGISRDTMQNASDIVQSNIKTLAREYLALLAEKPQTPPHAKAVTLDRLLDMRHNSDHAFNEAASSSWDDFALRFPDALQIACIHRRELLAALLSRA